MNQHIFIRTLLAFALVCMCGQAVYAEQPIDRKELRDSIQKIYDKLDKEYAVLEASRAYMKSADDLQNSFLARLDITVGIIGLFIAIASLLFGASIWLLIRTKMKAMTRNFDDKLQQHSDRLNNAYQQTIKEMYADNEKIIDRMMATEIITYELKKQTKVLFIHQTNSKPQEGQFGQLEAVIKKRFPKTESTYCRTLESIPVDDKFIGVAKKDAFKLIILNDDFFDINSKGFLNNKEDEKKIQDFFDKLDKSNVGLVLYGNTKFHDLQLRYIGFSNNPYTVYANINNLIKYMNAVKNLDKYEQNL